LLCDKIVSSASFLYKTLLNLRNVAVCLSGEE